MIKKVLILSLLLLLATISGCVSQKEYICPDGSIVSDPSLCPTTTITTTTILDCTTMNPNYCDNNDDCICSMSKCFKGNKLYAEHCVDEAEACLLNFCFFAPGEGMVCEDHTCQIGKKCYTEGESFDLLDTPNAVCCSDLTQISVSVLEGDMCVSPACPCYVCTECGDGECGIGENECNCPKDCA